MWASFQKTSTLFTVMIFQAFSANWALHHTIQRNGADFLIALSAVSSVFSCTTERVWSGSRWSLIDDDVEVKMSEEDEGASRLNLISPNGRLQTWKCMESSRKRN